jgi:uncharacterized RDD family membrane protein YckC
MWLPFVIGTASIWTDGFATFKVNVLQLSEIGAARALVVPLLVSHGVQALLWGAGLVLAAFHEQKRAAHDLLVGSRVVYRLGSPRFALLPEAQGSSGSR